MILLEKGFGFKFKKGIVFGVYEKYSMKTIRLPFVTITIPSKETAELFVRALRGIVHDDDWEVKQTEEIKAYKKKLEEEYWKKHADLEESIGKKNTRLSEENQKYYQENHELRRTIETMMGIKEDASNK